MEEDDIDAESNGEDLEECRKLKSKKVENRDNNISGENISKVLNNGMFHDDAQSVGENIIIKTPARGSRRATGKAQGQSKYYTIVKGQEIVLNVCRTCNVVKPPRSFHCSDCKACIEVHDHHCPWVGTCVGKRNHRFFFLFAVFTSVHATFTALLDLFYIL